MKIKHLLVMASSLVGKKSLEDIVKIDYVKIHG